ncbi:LysR family transcriptional regulator [Labilibaculum sp. DW002]|uniref:LysR family transcriptional regulator n=1 Tax=Paralabilibaculum antarcticum TaxID=2912572 RepID=A0ABT5VYJ4_9BACT|nr:LysR family transcriptional regulator [Labilibaculum sp. DW002]MDE5420483.1 LysR family transcriptional regulator [Labilibaculum sp. DW002]
MSNQIELRHYKYFLALAKDLHFRKAAERLYISQPGLSRQIKQMEEDLGINLFERHNRKVELTKAGLYLQNELTNTFKRLDDIIDHAKLLNDGMDGNLKLGYVGSAMQLVIPELLLKYKNKHPNVLFNLNEMDNDKQIHALLNQEIDVGFVRMERVPRGIEIQPVFEDTFSLVLPKDHPLTESNFNDLSQVKDESFILFDSSYSESYHEKVMQIFDESGFSPLVSHNTVNASSIFRLVENNFGISIVPTSLQLGYDMDVKFIELTEIPQRTTLKLVWNSVNTNPILEKFLHLTKL